MYVFAHMPTFDNRIRPHCFSPSPLPTAFLVFALALLLALALTPAQHAAAAAGTFTVSTCTDGAFQTAVTNAQAAGGGTVRFTCDGTIARSGTTNVTTALTLDATGHTVTIDGGNGMQLFTVNGGATFTVMNLTLTRGNAGGGDGGAISSSGTVYITNSTVSSSTAGGSGGGIYSYTGVGGVYVANSTFSGNTAGASGGGIASDGGGSVGIANSTFSDNTASGGIGGGAIGNIRSSGLFVRNSTISGNTGTSGGGGIGNNSGSTMNFFNILSSLVVNNTPNDYAGTAPGNATATSTGAFTFLAGLSDNGGPTFTLAINTASPAYQNGIACPLVYPGNGASLPYDQRGATRNMAHCSQGAFEPGDVNTATTLAATTGGASLASGGSVLVGSTVTFTVTVLGVLGSPVPDGSVVVRKVSTADCNPTTFNIMNSTGTCTTTDIVPGTNTFQALYFPVGRPPGAPNTVASTSPNFIINGVASTATTITAQTPNPSAPGQSVAFTVTVNSGSGGTPTGTVTLTDVTTDPMNPTPFASGTLTNGSVTILYAALPTRAHTIRANYGGSPSYVASVSPTVTQTVAKVNTTLALTNLPNPSAFGQAITLTATATSGNGTPDGTVSFTDITDPINAVALGGGPATLDMTGAASISVSTLSVGAHASGDLQRQRHVQCQHLSRRHAERE